MLSSGDSSARPRVGRIPRPAVWGLFFVLVLLSFAVPAGSLGSAIGGSPTFSTNDRLDDRRYVAAGTRGYVVGTEAGRFPAMSWHTRGEMDGI